MTLSFIEKHRRDEEKKRKQQQKVARKETLLKLRQEAAAKRAAKKQQPKRKQTRVNNEQQQQHHKQVRRGREDVNSNSDNNTDDDSSDDDDDDFNWQVERSTTTNNTQQQFPSVLEVVQQQEIPRNRKQHDPRSLPDKPYVQILAQATNPREVAVHKVKGQSMGTYLQYQKMVTTRISYRTGVNFPWSVEGLCDFITDPFVAEEISNKSVAPIISGFKTIYEIQHGQKIPTNDELVIMQLKEARNNIVPNDNRITGAINRERLLQLLELMKTKKNNNELSAEKYQLFSDMAIMLYCCALRIFQLESLTRSSFLPDKNGKNDWWVAVPIKGDRANLEQKAADNHPLIKQQFLEVLDRLRNECGPEQDTINEKLNIKQQKFFFDLSPSLIADFGKLMSQAGKILDWPSGQAWQGTHMFRHGSIQDAHKEGGLDLAILRGGHKAEKSVRLYAATDAERKGKLQEIAKDKKKKQEYLNMYLQHHLEKAKNISATRNTNFDGFKPADLQYEEKGKIEQNKNWERQIKVWETFRQAVLTEKVVQQEINNMTKDNNQTLNADSEFLKKLCGAVIEMKAQLQALTITVANQQKFPSKQGLPVNTNHQPNNNQLQKNK